MTTIQSFETNKHESHKRRPKTVRRSHCIEVIIQIRLLSDLNNNETKQDVNIINLITKLIIIIIITTTTLYYNCSSYLGKMFA